MAVIDSMSRLTPIDITYNLPKKRYHVDYEFAAYCREDR
jgi:hypothetical protein